MKCDKCGGTMYWVRDNANGKVIRWCLNKNCSLYKYEISFSN